MNITQWIPTHILTNMRSQISRNGYDDVSREAFLQVSDTDHNVLPRTIIEDQLDKQSSDLAKCFFSEDVENVLYKNKNYSEATFVCLTRNWYEACDKCGIATLQRLQYMQNMFNHLISWVDFHRFSTSINILLEGCLFKTFEMILQNISTCIQLFACSTEPINQRSISTLAIESFFSELTQMEFTGIGCPKVSWHTKIDFFMIHLWIIFDMIHTGKIKQHFYVYNKTCISLNEQLQY